MTPFQPKTSARVCNDNSPGLRMAKLFGELRVSKNATDSKDDLNKSNSS